MMQQLVERLTEEVVAPAGSRIPAMLQVLASTWHHGTIAGASIGGESTTLTVEIPRVEAPETSA